MTIQNLNKGRLNGRQRMRLLKLLDMEYTPAELADEIGFRRRQIYRVYRKLPDFPCRVDDAKHLWINGAAFRDWYRYSYPKIILGKNEVYCLTCRSGVEMVNPTRHVKNGLSRLVSYCSQCGRKVVKFTFKEKRI